MLHRWSSSVSPRRAPRSARSCMTLPSSRVGAEVDQQAPAIQRGDDRLVGARLEDGLDSRQAQAQEGIHAAFAIEHALSGEPEALQFERVVAGAIVLGTETRELDVPVRVERAAEGQRHADVVVGDAPVVEPQRVDRGRDVPAASAAPADAASRRECRDAKQPRAPGCRFFSWGFLPSKWPRIIAEPGPLSACAASAGWLTCWPGLQAEPPGFATGDFQHRAAPGHCCGSGRANAA